ncbi:glycosyltransferase [Alicyclobacillus curvatus]|nr:glycosyltransferase [Alicyclobacillus curvatus]
MKVTQVQQRLLQLPGPAFIREASREWLNRPPNQVELQHWRQQRLRKVSKRSVLYQLARSKQVKRLLTNEQPGWTVDGEARCVQRLYGLFHESDEGFVRGLYEELLHRKPSTGELHGWLETLRTGTDRWSVFQMMVRSTEVQSRWQRETTEWTVADVIHRIFRLSGPTFLAALTRELFARGPLPSERQRWGQAGVSVEGRERVFAALVSSDAFRRALVFRRLPGGRVARGRGVYRLRKLYRQQGAKFVADLYTQLLGRTPDAAGLNLHVSKLRQVRKLDILRSIFLSEEAAAHRAGEEVTVSAVLEDPLEPETGISSYDVSVIIPTVKQMNLVQTCVQSLHETTHGLKLEIIVVDDGSAEDIQAGLRVWGQQAKVRVLCKTTNQGFSKTINVGIKAAKGRHILLVNNDVVFHQHDTIRTMIQAMNAAPNIGIVGARLLFADGRIQHGGSYAQKDGLFPHRFIYQPGDHIPALVTDDVVAVTGALMLIRREVIEQIGTLSEEYYLAYEDVDYCYRARDAGWRVVYCGDAAAIHLQGATRGKTDDVDFEAYAKAEQVSFATFHNRWTKGNISPFHGKRVIYVLSTTGVAGGNKVVFEHMNRLHELGYSVELYSLQPPPHWFNVKIPVEVFDNYDQLLTALRPQNAYKVATWWETAPIVHASCDKVRGGQGVPFYLVQDLEASYYPNQPEQQARVHDTYRLEGMHYVTDGEWVQKELLNRHGQQTSLLSIAVDHDIFHPGQKADGNARCILAISRGNQHLKGFDVTVDALQQVVKVLPDVRVVTFGVIAPDIPGVPVEHIAHPSDEEVAELYRSSSVFVQTSNHEGFGLPLLESMACGTPVVATRADGNEEFCLDRYNCVLVNRGDSNAVAGGIIRVLTDPLFAATISDNGRRTAQRYSWNRVMYNLNNEFAKYPLR